MIELHNFDIWRVPANLKHINTNVVQAFNKELEKQLFQLMNAPELQDAEKVSAICAKNLNSIVYKMNNTKPLMIDMKPKDTIKVDILELDKS